MNMYVVFIADMSSFYKEFFIAIFHLGKFSRTKTDDFFFHIEALFTHAKISKNAIFAKKDKCQIFAGDVQMSSLRSHSVPLSKLKI